MTAPVVSRCLGCGGRSDSEHDCPQGTCPRCMVPVGDSTCCTPDRLARIVTVPAFRLPCGHLDLDDCQCGTAEVSGLPDLQMGTYGRSRPGRRS